MAGPTYGKIPPKTELDFGIVAKQEWREWAELREQAQWADETGWDSVWAFDHLFTLRDGDAGPNLEGWTLLAGLAACTQRVQLGLLVTGITYRHPAMLAKQAVTVDHISGGRLVLGVGAAWNEREHRAYGIPFPPAGERVDRFGEAMTLYRMLETQERTTFQGRYYSLEDAPFAPKPVYGHIPILIGSTGKRMLRHVARFADLWDGGGTIDEYRAHGQRLAELCQEIGRDPDEIRWVISAPSDLLASEAAVVEFVTAYAAVGVRSFLFNIPRGTPTPTMQAIAARVIPELRAAFREGTLV